MILSLKIVQVKSCGCLHTEIRETWHILYKSEIQMKKGKSNTVLLLVHCSVSGMYKSGTPFGIIN